MPQAVVWTAAVPFLTVLDAADPGPRCCRLLSSENSSWLADGHLLPVLSCGLSSRLPFPEEKERTRASKEVSKHSGIFSSSHKNQSYYMRVSLLEPHLIFSSVAQSCPTLCDPMDCSMPGLPVHHQLPELAQTHSHQVSDAIQPSHLLSYPSPPTFNFSQHQGLFQ